MIRKLREEAKAQLGPKFDIKAFHDEVVNEVVARCCRTEVIPTAKET